MKMICKKWPRIILHTFLILLSLVFIVPLLMVVSVSFTDEATLASEGFSLVPAKFSLAAYSYVFSNPDALVDAYLLTIFVSVSATALALIVTSMVAYSLSRRSFAYRKIITWYIFFTMLFSGGLIPSYIINTQYLHLGNNVLIYILPSLVSAWNVIIMRTFFQDLPDSVFESAKLDGASEWTIYFRICLPMSAPVLATIGFMLLMGKWNEWYSCLIYIRDSRLYTLQYLLQKILNDSAFVQKLSENIPSGVDLAESIKVPTESMKFAMCILATGPMFLIFPFFQKYVSKGLTIGAVKG